MYLYIYIYMFMYIDIYMLLWFDTLDSYTGLYEYMKRDITNR